jgi:hypothetical protein
VTNEWPRLLADLKAKRDCLTEAIDAIERVFTIPEDDAPRRASTSAKKIGKRAIKKRTNERTNEQKSGRHGAALTRRSLPKKTKTGAHRQAILDILRAKSPQSPGELMKRAGFHNLAALRYQLKPLMKEGLVTVTGATMNRQVSLGRARAAKEAP